MKHFLFAALILFLPASAIAAPSFCAATSFGTNCWYHLMDQCREAVASNGATCPASRQEMHQSTNGAPFCVAASRYASLDCRYYTSDSCLHAAQSIGGTCFVMKKG